VTRAMQRLGRALVGACAALALVVPAAQGAAEPHPHIGKLPGFPAMRGVVPVLGSNAAVAAHEKLVTSAFASARARFGNGAKAAAEPNKQFVAACEAEEAFLASHDACYRGGPVLRDPTVHLIFWQGGSEAFPPGYVAAVEQYFEDVAHDSGTQTNVYAVDPQYGDTTGLGEYRLAFKAEDATVDTTHAFPSNGPNCVDKTPSSEGPCLLDADIQKEVATVAGGSEKGLHDIYIVLTPPGVGGCFDNSSGECAFKQYCAYHGDFGGDGVTVGQQTIYADLPFVGNVVGCDPEVHPNASVKGADAVIDGGSHELNEVITDPIGSQCKTGALGVSECEHNAWTDAIGQEIADKCLPPESTIAGTYGEALGELTPGNPASAYNQLINGDHYYTQRVWSNEAGLFEGGCVQRTIDARFSVSAGAAATVPVILDGSASGAAGDPATYWVWSFSGGEQIGMSSPTLSHTFAQPGAQEVGLTAYDRYGNAQGTVEIVNVGAAPLPPLPPPAPPAPAPPVVVKEPASPPGHFTAAQMAAKLGLPANSKKLAGSGRIALGRGECPPACAVAVQLYAKLTTTTHGRRSTKLVPIGSLRLAIAAKGTSALSLSLNAKGRTLLRKLHTLPAQLQVTVEGQEGGSWQIVRSLTITR
jgi:PKD domain